MNALKIISIATLVIGLALIFLGSTIIGCGFDCSKGFGANSMMVIVGVVLLVLAVVLFLLGKRK